MFKHTTIDEMGSSWIIYRLRAKRGGLSKILEYCFRGRLVMKGTGVLPVVVVVRRRCQCRVWTKNVFYHWTYVVRYRRRSHCRLPLVRNTWELVSALCTRVAVSDSNNMVLNKFSVIQSLHDFHGKWEPSCACENSNKHSLIPRLRKRERESKKKQIYHVKRFRNNFVKQNQSLYRPLINCPMDSAVVL